MADINIGKFINNIDDEDLTSEKLQGVVNNVYAKAISTHKKKQKEVEENTKEQDEETVKFVKSNHDRLKAHKNRPEKDIDKDDATAKDKVAKEINESFANLSNKEKIDYVINNYKKITGRNISGVYAKGMGEDENAPIFDQDHIDATADRIEKFLKKNGMSSKEIDDFYYDLDAELAARYNELSVRKPKGKVNEDFATEIEKLYSDDYVWNMHNTDFEWLHKELDHYRKPGEDFDILTLVRRLPKLKQRELYLRMLEPVVGEKLVESKRKINEAVAEYVETDRETGATIYKDADTGRLYANYLTRTVSGSTVDEVKDKLSKLQNDHINHFRNLPESKKINEETILPGNIYDVLVKKIPAKDIDHYNSDLYVRKTPQSTEIINKLSTKSLLSTFKDNIDGDIWYELPFCYTPHLEKKESKKVNEAASPKELYWNKEEALKDIWGLVCEGDDRLEDIRYIFESGLLKPNEFRYDRFGAKHSLIMGALRNGNYKTVELLKSLGEKILKSEVEEYKDIMAKRVYSDETVRGALDESRLAYYKYRGCTVRETPSTFVAINEHGLNIGESPTASGAEGIIDDYLKKQGVKEVVGGQPKREGSFAEKHPNIKLKKESLKEELSDEDIFDILGIEQENRTNSKHLLSQFRKLQKKYGTDSIWLKGDVGSAVKGKVIGRSNDLAVVESKQTKVNETLDDPNKTEFHYAFQITKNIIFNVDYYTLGSNTTPHFSTSANEFNRPKSDYKTGGQAQESLLKRFPTAYNFYKKWDKYHLRDLTDEQYEDLLKDIENLKQKYNFVEQKQETFAGTNSGIRFSQARELSKQPLKKGAVKTESKKLKEAFNSSDIADWLEEHEQAAEDCKTFFKVDDLSKVRKDRLISWISDHDTLAQDFENYFGFSINESLKEEVDYWNGKQPTTQKELEDKIKSLQKNHSFQFNGFEIYNNGDKFEYFHNSMEKKSSRSPKEVAKKVFNFKYRENNESLKEGLDANKVQKLVDLFNRSLITKDEFKTQLDKLLGTENLVAEQRFENTKIKDFYTDNYPDDELGKEISDTVTVKDVVDLLNNGRGDEIYELLGPVADSVLRERIFAFIADVCGVKYDVVYNKWLEESFDTKSLKEARYNDGVLRGQHIATVDLFSTGVSEDELKKKEQFGGHYEIDLDNKVFTKVKENRVLGHWFIETYPRDTWREVEQTAKYLMKDGDFKEVSNDEYLKIQDEWERNRNKK